MFINFSCLLFKAICARRAPGYGLRRRGQERKSLWCQKEAPGDGGMAAAWRWWLGCYRRGGRERACSNHLGYENMPCRFIYRPLPTLLFLARARNRVLGGGDVRPSVSPRLPLAIPDRSRQWCLPTCRDPMEPLNPGIGSGITCMRG